MSIRRELAEKMPNGDRFSLDTVGSGTLPDPVLIEKATQALSTYWDIVPVSGCAWSPLEVRLEASPERTHGIGENPLHIDYVSHASPPRFIAMLCLRADPNGGGGTQLASFAEAISKVPSHILMALRKPLYSYWPDPTGGPFGEPLKTFSIAPNGSTDLAVRYSAKMLDQSGKVKPEVVFHAGCDREIACEAITEFDQCLRVARETFVLNRAELLVFDQFQVAHGRTPLAGDQSAIPAGRRRLLMQAYLRHKRCLA